MRTQQEKQKLAIQLGSAIAVMGGLAILFHHPAPKPSAAAATVARANAPFQGRAYVTIQRVTVGAGLSNKHPGQAAVGLEVLTPDGKMIDLPKQGDWSVVEGTSHSIFETMEVPKSSIQNDGFRFTIQMYRGGETYEPCVFHVEKLSEFNRTYVCHSVSGSVADTSSELAVQVEVFTDLNLSPAEVKGRLARR